MKNIKTTLQYSAAFGTFWAMDCILIGYGSVFLQAHGYSNTFIGIIIAAANMLSAIIQIVAADIADRSKKVSLFDIVIFFAVVIMGIEVLILLQKGKSVLMFVTYTAVTGIHLAHQSQLNAMSGILARRKLEVEYGICRGVGSLCSAVTSYLMGSMIAKKGVSILVICGEIIMLIFVIANVLLNFDYSKTTIADENQSDRDRDITMKEFISRHKIFLIMCLGILIMFYHQQMINNFMLQIFQSTGGGARALSVYFFIMPLIETVVLLSYSKFRKYFGAKTILKFSSFMYIVRGLLMVLAVSKTGIMLSLIAHPFCHPLFLAAIVEYIDEIMDYKETVRGQSLYVIVITLSALITSLTGGMIIDAWGAHRLLITGFICSIVGFAIILPSVDRAELEAADN